MSVPVEVVIAAARLFRPWDGDSGDLLVNFKRRGTWRHAQVVGVRLRGYRAREAKGALKNEPELDPVTGEVIRVSGVEAARITTNVLINAVAILVEFTGANSLDREVCDIHVQRAIGGPLEPLGPVLMMQRVVLPGDTMGVQGDSASRP